jgi:hypothetical protein
LDRIDIDIREVECRAHRAGVTLPVAYLSGAEELPRGLFLHETLTRDARVVAGSRAEREGEALDLARIEELGEPRQVSVDENGVCEALLRCAPGGALALLCRRGGAFEISVADAQGERALELATSLAAAIRVKPRPRDPRVAVAFWAGPGEDPFSSGGPRWRRLALPRLADIADNYPTAVRAGLTELCAHASGDVLPGRLALWHGLPGTGKTWALRALGREWSGWCDLHYITDPERLLGGDSAYMLKVLAGRSDPDLDEDRGEPERDREERWRLLVLEDAGELLGLAAPAEVGRGFARLLNIADGLLGQGSRALILVTTNEPLGKLHPAALRPGRAMATLEFTPLPAVEAGAWLATRGVERTLGSATTIAELHAILAGVDATAPASTRVPVGFA